MNKRRALLIIFVVLILGLSAFSYVQTSRLANIQRQMLEATNDLMTTKNNLEIASQELVQTKDTLSATTNELKQTKDMHSTAIKELADTKNKLQSTQDELFYTNQGLKDKATEYVVLQKQFMAAQKEILSYKEVFPLREFGSLSELQGFLMYNARLWQLDLMEMQQDVNFGSLDYAKALQAAANSDGYSMSVQIDKSTGQIFNTVLINKTIYAIDPFYSTTERQTTNKVWVYWQQPVPNPVNETTTMPTNSTSLSLAYENSSNHFKVRYPEGWKITEDLLSSGVALLIPKQNTSDLTQDNVIIAVQKTSASTLYDLTQMTLTQCKQYITDFALIESSDTTLANNKAHRLVFSGKQGSNNFKFMAVYTISGTNAYTINYTAGSSTYLDNLATVQKIIGSFEITQ
jgi:hypothetical protein